MVNNFLHFDNRLVQKMAHMDSLLLDNLTFCSAILRERERVPPYISCHDMRIATFTIILGLCTLTDSRLNLNKNMTRLLDGTH